MTDSIWLSGLTVWARHGVLPHEREHGQQFVVDLRLDLDLAPASRSDALGDTVDYGRLAGLVHDAVAAPPCDLIETVAARVVEVCFADARVEAVEVTVRKPAAPLPVPASEVAVTLRRKR